MVWLLTTLLRFSEHPLLALSFASYTADEELTLCRPKRYVPTPRGSFHLVSLLIAKSLPIRTVVSFHRTKPFYFVVRMLEYTSKGTNQSDGRLLEVTA